MEKDLLVQFESKCIQEEAPYCRAACPIHVDARALCAAWADKNEKAARLILERTMPLPGLTAHLCEAPCQEACLRADYGGALAVGELERAAVNLARRQTKFLPVPPKDKSAAVLGAGAAGLAAAWDLAKKGWQVELFHRSETTGAETAGTELADYARTCPAEQLEAGLNDLAALGAALQPLPPIDQASIENMLTNHDAVLVDCLVLDPEKLGLDPAKADPVTLQSDRPNLFAAGFSRLRGQARFIDDLSEGRRAATSIDRLLRGVSLTAERKGEGPQPTGLQTDAAGTITLAPVNPADPAAGYTADEAKAEAKRCLRCDCMQCVRRCVYLQEYGGHPKAYTRQIYNNEAIVKGSRDANSLILSCSLCGQCAEICPHDFSMAELCLGARERMVETGHMPPSAHYFALREMESAWDPKAHLARTAPGEETSAWLFFPGCQLSGLRPDQVEAVYNDLRGRLPGGVALMLACCGAPAHWAGRRAEFDEVLARIQQAWQDLDCPRVVTGCTSCLAVFRRELPALDPVSLWQIWAEQGAPPPVDLKNGSPAPAIVAMEDPCTARDEPEIQAAARELAKQAGRKLRELPGGGRLTECCGFGGLAAEANPELADKAIRNRADQDEADYLTYCAMCRERLVQAGKRSLHLLDLYFPPIGEDDPAATPALGLSRRWDNRAYLRDRLARNLWPQEAAPEQPWSAIKLEIAPAVEAVMDQRRILAEDLRRVLHQTAGTESGFIDRETGRTLVSGQLGPVTYWIEYTITDGAYEIHRTWSHRMVVGRAKS